MIEQRSDMGCPTDRSRKLIADTADPDIPTVVVQAVAKRDRRGCQSIRRYVLVTIEAALHDAKLGWDIDATVTASVDLVDG